MSLRNDIKELKECRYVKQCNSCSHRLELILKIFERMKTRATAWRERADKFEGKLRGLYPGKAKDKYIKAVLRGGYEE